MSTHQHRLSARNQAVSAEARRELDKDARLESARALGGLLIEVVDVALCAKHARFNIRDSRLQSVKELLATISKDLMGQADLVGDRIAALGCEVSCTAQQIAARTTLKPYPAHVLTTFEQVDAIAYRLGMLGAEARIAIAECQEVGDLASVHALKTALATFDRLLWLTESHLVKTH